MNKKHLIYYSMKIILRNVHLGLYLRLLYTHGTLHKVCSLFNLSSCLLEKIKIIKVLFEFLCKKAKILITNKDFLFKFHKTMFDNFFSKMVNWEKVQITNIIFTLWFAATTFFQVENRPKFPIINKWQIVYHKSLYVCIIIPS